MPVSVTPRALLRLVLVLLAAMALGPSVAAAKQCRDETGLPSPIAVSPGLAKLVPNPDRPALALPLDDRRGDTDLIVFGTEPRKLVGRNDLDVTAAFLAFPRREARRLKADVTVKARPAPTRDRVTLKICVQDKSRFAAGTYQGTVLLRGPNMTEFTYPVSITTKMTFWVPALLLAAVILAYLLLAWKSDSPPGRTRASTWNNIIASLIYGAVAIAAAALTYWSVYVKNATWGEDPAVQIPALVVAALTSVIAAQEAAKQWINRRGG